jgi:FlaG/FlaF family flagellin (archaellin)
VSTYTFSRGPFSIKILPQSTTTGLEWVVAIYAEGVQGSVTQSAHPITAQQADDLGMRDKTRRRINDTLRYAQAELSLPDSFKTATDKRSLSDLEEMMDREQSVFET